MTTQLKPSAREEVDALKAAMAGLRARFVADAKADAAQEAEQATAPSKADAALQAKRAHVIASIDALKAICGLDDPDCWILFRLTAGMVAEHGLIAEQLYRLRTGVPFREETLDWFLTQIDAEWPDDIPRLSPLKQEAS